MQDLFERESSVLARAKKFLDGLVNPPPDYYYEFINMTIEYEYLLRQARLMNRCSDLTALGLHTDKQKLLDKVNIDKLTGIYNRRFIEENLYRYYNLLSRTDGSISLLMIDIDFFKNYNDTYGHMAGDICLRKVAEALQNTVNRAEDFVARYGGEEFLVLLSNISTEGTMVVAEHILENIRALEIPHASSKVADIVTVSVGAMTTRVSWNHKPQQYIMCADAALYKSKQTGRNKKTFYHFEEELYD